MARWSWPMPSPALAVARCWLTNGIWTCVFPARKNVSARRPDFRRLRFNQRAMDVIHARKTPVQSWYLDMSLVETYWGDTGAGGRAYHHTAPSNALFGLHEALRMALLEGLENRWARHEMHSRALMAGLGELGLKPFAQEGHRLWQLNAVVHSRRH